MLTVYGWSNGEVELALQENNRLLNLTSRDGYPADYQTASLNKGQLSDLIESLIEFHAQMTD